MQGESFFDDDVMNDNVDVKTQETYTNTNAQVDQVGLNDGANANMSSTINRYDNKTNTSTLRGETGETPIQPKFNLRVKNFDNNKRQIKTEKIWKPRSNEVFRNPNFNQRQNQKLESERKRIQTAFANTPDVGVPPENPGKNSILYSMFDKPSVKRDLGMYKIKDLSIASQQRGLASVSAYQSLPTFNYTDTWFGKILTNRINDISNFFLPNPQHKYFVNGNIKTFDLHRNQRGLTSKGVELTHNAQSRPYYINSTIEKSAFDQVLTRKPVSKPKLLYSTRQSNIDITSNAYVRRNLQHGIKDWDDSYKKTFPTQWSKNWDFNATRSASVAVDVPWRQIGKVDYNDFASKRTFNYTPATQSLGLKTVNVRPEASLSTKIQTSNYARQKKHVYTDSVSKWAQPISSFDVLKNNRFVPDPSLNFGVTRNLA